MCLCWVFFRAQTFEQALIILQKLFVWSGGVVHIYSWSLIAIVCLAIATIWCFVFSRNEKGEVHGRLPGFDFNSFWGCLAFFLLLGLALVTLYTGENPFIYFQF